MDHDTYYNYLAGRSKVGGIYRTHWLYPIICKRLKGHTLDIGCGIGDMLMFRPNTVGVDINKSTVSHCQSRGLNAHVMAEDSLPFSDGDFDSVLLDNVLEHISEPGQLLTEIRRVLKPKGVVVIGVPGVRGWHSDPDHKVLYDEKSLSSVMSDHGFQCDELFHTPLWQSDWLSTRVRQYCIYGKFSPKRIVYGRDH